VSGTQLASLPEAVGSLRLAHRVAGSDLRLACCGHSKGYAPQAVMLVGAGVPLYVAAAGCMTTPGPVASSC
jgi:hypothetical protein